MTRVSADEAADVLGTLLQQLNQRTAGMRKPVGQAFMLNNGMSTSMHQRGEYRLTPSIAYTEYYLVLYIRHHWSRCRGYAKQGIPGSESVSNSLLYPASHLPALLHDKC